MMLVDADNILSWFHPA